MGRAGASKGAGRKPGAATELNQAAREKVLIASGTSPLDFMLAIMRGEDIPRADRFEAAKAAAPYVHARLAAADDVLTIIAAGSGEGASEAPLAGSNLLRITSCSSRSSSR
ncbi:MULTISPECIES: hypothetical protein [Bradyrhizobium]|uniref:hypothetical protein n=1 Tax=Bradyrhizobium TaxID=374 RepID=UPI0018AD3DE8|nr:MULTISPECIES: hypothetical protein [Bradyrhizobium]